MRQTQSATGGTNSWQRGPKLGTKRSTTNASVSAWCVSDSSSKCFITDQACERHMQHAGMQGGGSRAAAGAGAGH